ncbi:MAG: glycosyltransferase [Pseudobutyrivibrio sp.]|uniref:glycosyltransferase n=1 Tax=Pseudobutyrivibrio sp. TaxID=2014367 RepID=UPI0025EF2975|nr:glycosyltransferase [Pseudobutyrivibrio sp.]MBQ8490304.1 glycosyltransferase [Pseudobutyrivibrio sp.]
MNNKPKTKLLTISLLCCGRPDTTERCLKSLMPIREAIDSEIQVVDTGCSKETRAIIEKYADEVFEFTWCNDFGKARNFQLDQANGKMFLYIDDDEWFLDCKYIIEFFKEPDCTSYNIGGYFQRNYLDFDGREYQDIEVCRMCSVTPETTFKGKIHEYIEPAYGNAMFMDARAGHFGYVHVSDEENIKHSMRNIPLIEEMMAEEPDNMRWPYQLAQEWKSIKRFEEMLKVCTDAYEKLKSMDDNESLRYRGSFVCGIAIAYHQMDRNDELIELYEREAKKPDIMEIPLACIAFYAATVFFKTEQAQKCKDSCNYYLKIYEKYKGDQGAMFIQGGLFSNDSFDETKSNMIYCFLMAIGLEENDYGPLTHYYRRINWNSEIVRLNRGFVVTLLKKASEVGYKKEISTVLNKFFTTAGFRDMIEYHIENVNEHLNEEELSNILNAFKGTSGEKEIKLFIGIRILEKQFAQIEEWDSYSQLVAELKNYANTTLEWQALHDSFFNKKNDVKLPVDRTTMLGQGILQFLEHADDDVKESLTILKNLFGIRPAMTGAISKLSRLYSERAKVISARQQNPEKFAEMYNLEEALLHQIADLDATGHTEEAISTYRQLVDVLQASFGVDTLHI